MRVHELRQEGERAAGEGGASRRRALPPRYWAFWAHALLGVASEWCVGYWGAEFLAEKAGLTRAGAATALTLFFVAMLAGRVLGSRLARALPPSVLLAGTLGVALAGFPCSGSPGGRADPGRPLRDRFGIGSVYPLGVSTALAAVPGNADAAAARLAVGGAVLLAPFALGALADRVGIGAALGVVLPMLLAAALLALAAVWGRLAGS